MRPSPTNRRCKCTCSAPCLPSSCWPSWAFFAPLFVDRIARDAPVAQAGEIDFAAFGPVEQPVELRGDWKLTSVSPDTSGGLRSGDGGTIKVPSAWAGMTTSSGATLPSSGRATYTLVMSGLKPGNYGRKNCTHLTTPQRRNTRVSHFDDDDVTATRPIPCIERSHSHVSSHSILLSSAQMAAMAPAYARAGQGARCLPMPGGDSPLSHTMQHTSPPSVAAPAVPLSAASSPAR
jgi:hypothetical protein